VYIHTGTYVCIYTCMYICTGAHNSQLLAHSHTYNVTDGVCTCTVHTDETRSPPRNRAEKQNTEKIAHNRVFDYFDSVFSSNLFINKYILVRMNE
jgi:hypothetical protein